MIKSFLINFVLASTALIASELAVAQNAGDRIMESKDCRRSEIFNSEDCFMTTEERLKGCESPSYRIMNPHKCYLTLEEKVQGCRNPGYRIMNPQKCFLTDEERVEAHYCMFSGGTYDECYRGKIDCSSSYNQQVHADICKAYFESRLPLWMQHIKWEISQRVPLERRKDKLPSPSPERTARLDPEAISALVTPSVYQVYALLEHGDAGGLGLGAAVAISADLLVTACHVVQSAKTIAVTTPKWGDFAVVADVWVNENGHDRCWIKLRPGGKPLQPVPGIRPAERLKQGEPIYALGHPQGLDYTFSDGVVSAVRPAFALLVGNPDNPDDPDRLGPQLIVQFTAPINQGNSGGGLFDRHGNLIGVVSAGGEGNLNFAVAIEEFWP